MWKGWYVQFAKYEMQVEVTFREGTITARGRDAQLGAFTLRGRYTVDDGRCHWTKVYDALTGANHHVFYQGFNEGRGIWGTWELPSLRGHPAGRGGFLMWPEGWPDPSGGDVLHEQLDAPGESEVPEFGESPEPVRVRMTFAHCRPDVR